MPPAAAAQSGGWGKYLPPEGEVSPAAAEGGGSAGESHFPPRGKCPLRQRGLIEIMGEVMMTSPGTLEGEVPKRQRGCVAGEKVLFWGASAAWC